MARTVSIPDDVHILIVKKQTEIREKYKMTVRISDLIAVVMRDGIDRSERLLGLGGVLQPNIVRGPDVKIKSRDGYIQDDVVESGEIKNGNVT